MMVTRQDWEIVYRELMARGRETDPPTPEEIDAYLRGDLEPAEQDSIGEKLAYYPELASALYEDPAADDHVPPLLTKPELEHDWAALQQRLNEPVTKPNVLVPFVAPSRPWRFATAASWFVTAVFGTLLLRATFTIDAIREEQTKPRENVERIELVDGAYRGSRNRQAIVLRPSTEHVVISLPPHDDIPGDTFRVEIRNLDTSPSQSMWRGTITRGHDGTFSIEVPRAFLRARNYALDLYADTLQRPAVTYEFRLPAP